MTDAVLKELTDLESLHASSFADATSRLWLAWDPRPQAPPSNWDTTLWIEDHEVKQLASAECPRIPDLWNAGNSGQERP